MYKRLEYLGLKYDKDHLDLLENMTNNIKYPVSKRTGWLSYRIMDDMLKSLFLKKESDKYMPFELKKCGIRL